MKNPTVNKISASAIVSIITSALLFSSLTSTVVAQPNSNQQLNQAAKDLGVPAYMLTAVNNPAVAKPHPVRRQVNRPNPAQQRVVQRPDPYAAKRRQINLQNIARRKALLNRLAQQKRLRYQKLHQQRKQKQGNHHNVWDRVYQGFRFGNYNNNPLVRRYTAELSRSPVRIQRLAERSSDYLYMVVNELNRRNMPTELALLPFVESAYRNNAYSHAGAAGMWQFIRATGRHYGLQQTGSYDARLDPKKATDAALNYLQRMNREFRGDWFLTLAGYNAGEYRVHREIAKNRKLGRPTDFWSLNLPRETRQYVPRLLAYKEIFRRPQAFGVRLRGIPNTPALAKIHVNKAVNLKKAAAQAGLPANTLTKINSGYLHGITTPRYSNQILLPRQHAGRLIKVIQRLPPAKDVHNKRAYRYAKKSRRRSYRVKRGDSLYRIAKKYGTTVKRLKRINRLRNSRIRAGKRIRV